MNYRHLAFAAALVPAMAFALPSSTSGQQGLGLSPEGKKFLDSLMADFLFDPKGAERVSVQVPVRTIWATTENVQVSGWFVAGKDGEQGRIYFTNGASIPAPPAKEMQKVNLVAFCKTRYGPRPRDDKKKEFATSGDLLRTMKLAAVGIPADHDLALAAWLYRLGEDKLAAQALAVAGNKSDDDPRDVLRNDLAWAAFAPMIHAFMVRADEEALAHGERLLRLYPEEAKKTDFKQTDDVIKDLKRRQDKGTFGKEPAAQWPEGFDKWDAAKKTVFLIEALEEVDTRQPTQPGWPNLALDRRVGELIRIGDLAVPFLIDTVENDNRLTRSVQFFRDFAHHRTVLSVREAALTALANIMHRRLYEPASTSDNFTSRGPAEARLLARKLRVYWKEFGAMPFDDRMMKVLTAPLPLGSFAEKQRAFADKREAALNLALTDPVAVEEKDARPNLFGDRPSAPMKNPVVAKFNKPTVAEAIVSAMNSELALHDAVPRERGDIVRRTIEDAYISALVRLGDTRIAEDLTKLANDAKSLRTRLQWSEAAHYLGDPKPFAALADEFRTGKIKPLPTDRELRALVVSFLDAATSQTNAALAALADAKHPLHQMVSYHVLFANPTSRDDVVWLGHPFCLQILRAAINNVKTTGVTFSVERGSLLRKDLKTTSLLTLPLSLSNPDLLRAKAAERFCDSPAEKLSELVIGLPRYHVLFTDADTRLWNLKSTFDRFASNFRLVNPRERIALGLPNWSAAFIPDIQPLDHPATAADVKAGKAIFHFGGTAKLADLALPAVAILKVDAKSVKPPPLLIVQAEIAPSGELTYGIITRDDIRHVSSREVTDVKSFADLEK